jgi:hypothetical protein
MGLRYRDLVIDVQAPPKPCGCTGTAPACTKGSQNPPDPRPNCPKPSAGRPPKRFGGLELLREQLRAELRTSG